MNWPQVADNALVVLVCIAMFVFIYKMAKGNE